MRRGHARGGPGRGRLPRGSTRACERVQRTSDSGARLEARGCLLLHAANKQARSLPASLHLIGARTFRAGSRHCSAAALGLCPQLFFPVLRTPEPCPAVPAGGALSRGRSRVESWGHTSRVWCVWAPNANPTRGTRNLGAAGTWESTSFREGVAVQYDLTGSRMRWVCLIAIRTRNKWSRLAGRRPTPAFQLRFLDVCSQSPPTHPH